ncbi:hypothetical protein [Virgibacillus pantothenticus]|nr:hypothetical protein [Virgibacillus pantothenticus]
MYIFQYESSEMFILLDFLYAIFILAIEIHLCIQSVFVYMTIVMLE